ncbi:type 2 isopentenyl-diphosphate Delta-isomerase [Mesobacillus zeae]|uniref:Isopentenyl-diphosphate delta-isomerase n=1 Tax=Mesobacillus zeae TaxID=1917180 RepID=A0A398BEU8_9BACI|nr:type 2 isopentenyl-diphosphate Delta-isomerase [Mesobacillus zeae]RID87308.1 type 2 isopentenyl-diphosphate Delta-isomerase [Mesobacillus zeae]
MTRSQRKLDHIKLSMETGRHSQNGLEDITFVHQSLPGTKLKDINLNTKIGGLSLSSPIFINAMTGGGGEKTLEINRNLAIAARETDLAMAVGSQMAAIRDWQEEKTFKVVREENPKGIIFANLGSELSPEQACKAVAMIEADALQIHLNVIQELAMPEGDRDFSGSVQRIAEAVKAVDVPVIVKETGFGMGLETVNALLETGIAAVDIGGFGGTNFASIENFRRNRPLPFLEEWGIPTAASIAEANHAAGNKVTVMASGGIHNSLDIAKSIALGAGAAGLAGQCLRILLDRGTEALIEELEILKTELAVIMTALGAANIKDLHKTPLIISGRTHHWLNQRGIDTKQFSTRL